MLKYILISALATGILSGASGNAAKAIPLEPGRVYRTGSPLSQPGIIGLGGGLVGMKAGGGYEVWNGPYVSPQDDVWDVDGAWSTATVAQYRAPVTLRMDDAGRRVDGSTGDGQNRPRSDVPDCDSQLYVSFVPDAVLGARMIYTCGGAK